MIKALRKLLWRRVAALNRPKSYKVLTELPVFEVVPMASLRFRVSRLGALPFVVNDFAMREIGQEISCFAQSLIHTIVVFVIRESFF